jgi:hypothetical protein
MNSTNTNERVRIVVSQQNGLTVYSASAWPGRQDVLISIVGFVVISIVLGFILFMFHMAKSIFNDFSGIEWLDNALRFLVAGTFDFSLIALLGFTLLWIPYFLIYQLSSKRVWLEDNTLCHTVRLLGIIPRMRRIPFERIVEIEIAPSGSLYHLKAVYEMKLPKWLYAILAYWNEKFTKWPLTLINAFPTRREAEWLQTQLLEPMTKTNPD